MANSWAQNGSISGTITDKKGETVPGVSVTIQGSTIGAVTDLNGKYKIDNLTAGKYKLSISFVGFDTQAKEITLKEGENLTLDTKLEESSIGLKEMVVVGYGTTAKKDLTGAVTSVSAKDFNRGSMATPEQLLTGKVAGVQITSKSGAPGSGSTIRIRGGSSLNASNDPLIVIDGIPVDNGTINGSANPLSLINPNDIENMTILKDASATAIYGSRGANGVIIITTKRGVADGKIHVDISSTTNFSKIIKYVDVLSADEYRTLVNDSGTLAQKKLLGDANTDWQKEIFRTAWGTDNNVAISGGVKALPYRLSIGYYNQEGILKRSQMDKKSIGLNLSPSLLNNDLKIELTTKLTSSQSWFADQGAIGTAVHYDPTKPIYPDTTSFNYNPSAAHNAELGNYGGYFEWTDPTSGNPNNLAPKNPVGLLYQREDIGYANRFIGNIGADYKIHWFPDLKVHVNAGGDQAWSHGHTRVPETAASQFYQKGEDTHYKQQRENYLFDAYVNYLKEFGKGSIKSKLDLTAGYEKQYWVEKKPAKYIINALEDTIPGGDIIFEEDHGFRSYFARLNYYINEKYLFTFNYRYDLSSRFAKDVRGGHFPSAAFAWRVKDESFLKDVKILSDLKLRLGYGIVGQQDGIANYAYIANYNQGTSTAQYQIGNNYYYVLRPDAYDAKLKWERTTTYNGGLDIAFFNGRVALSADYYIKHTKDLLATIPAPAGTNFSNNILTNVGSTESKGIELALNLIPIVNRNLEWQVGFNFTKGSNKLTKLNKIEDPNNPGVPIGNINGGTGSTVQIHSVGYPTYSFYVYKQKYDSNGKPISGTGDVAKDTVAYEDLNGDGKITPDDRYRYKDPAPKLLFGFNTSVTYKNFFAGLSARAQMGGYVYNNVNSEAGNFAYVDGSKNYIDNITSDYYETNFTKKTLVATNYLSDYYVEKADFIKFDYVNAGYIFKNILKSNMTLKASLIVNNLYTISKYKGIDPEIEDHGIDKSIYPRPRVYSVSLNLTF